MHEMDGTRFITYRSLGCRALGENPNDKDAQVFMKATQRLFDDGL